MDRKLKKWEVCLMLGLLCALFSGAWLERERTELSDRVIRLHVIANSDSPADQNLKLAVRDRVLEQAQTLYPAGADLDTARAALEGSLSRLAAAGRQEVERQGYDYPVTARLVRCHFPTREYDGFALPAGEYTALRVVIGAGEGRNWWCVAFPPLCLGAASETVDDAVTAGLFTPEQGALMTREKTRLNLVSPPGKPVPVPYLSYLLREHFSASMASTTIRAHRALRGSWTSMTYVSVRRNSSLLMAATSFPRSSRI